ncbi:phosphatidylinositol N-acetylglucosaminyltransferase GPI19 SCDLUD_003327 [Saccharomycodes ludwigii]|uniref:phosphatidylinositol N-acetylglucosaminyltransferase GPI19 n=1 Tax=Saccharomycodes ludwigii TaxID=36035 RepID=UPI001E88FB69|nr:hypothetical protein SCDLUD_003327 [Saccharomycodes ludwigii]KAH3900353.1 hypothetical protein SCDLUD_003327 [Saccharomycodes ludwigii]
MIIDTFGFTIYLISSLFFAVLILNILLYDLIVPILTTLFGNTTSNFKEGIFSFFCSLCDTSKKSNSTPILVLFFTFWKNALKILIPKFLASCFTFQSVLNEGNITSYADEQNNTGDLTKILDDFVFIPQKYWILILSSCLIMTMFYIYLVLPILNFQTFRPTKINKSNNVNTETDDKCDDLLLDNVHNFVDEYSCLLNNKESLDKEKIGVVDVPIHRVCEKLYLSHNTNNNIINSHIEC